mmetsp:Transcript_1650/g.5378  ORF Transcript_1650/g.5378 Transcript_1650/m.5378 type:complete len:217 (-) Transcript_1650:8-658(-)
MPALTWLPAYCFGFSTNRDILPSASWTTTPYREGSSTLVTSMVPSLPWFLWKARSSASGKVQVTSELSTKKGSVVRSTSRAYAMGPAVPRGSRSWEHVIFTSSSWLHLRRNSSITVGEKAIARTISRTPTLTRASTRCCSCGRFAKSIKGFGLERVSGRSCVPKPPTRMSAFMGLQYGQGRRRPALILQDRRNGRRLRTASGGSGRPSSHARAGVP